MIESVQVDGGAFNVREGNHALNLAAIYGLRSHLDPFFTLTGDYRDITATAGMSPSPNSWAAMEGSFGNGFLDRLEHRKQFKFNGGRIFHAGDHTLTLFGIAYLGYGYVAGLRPIYGFNSVDAAAGWMAYPGYDRSAPEGPDAHRAGGAERCVEAERPIRSCSSPASSAPTTSRSTPTSDWG